MNAFTKKAAACALGIALLGGGIAVAAPAAAAPVAPEVSATVNASPLAVTGGLGYTPGEATTLTGTASPGASVQVYGAGVDATVRADAEGRWSAEAGYALNGAAEQVWVYSQGQNVSVWAKPGNGDGLAPEQRELTVTGGLGYTPGERTTLTGEASPFASVRVYGAGVDATVRADAEGRWSAEAEYVLNGEAEQVWVYSQGQNVSVWAKPGNGDGLAPEGLGGR